jgi:hypothetical protein
VTNVGDRATRSARVRHRVRQFIDTLMASLRPVNEAEAAGYVAGAPDARSLELLFLRMPRAEQQHGVLVCRRLKAQGFTSSDLLVAGLLHDVGKSVHPPRLWQRVAVVLIEHYLPQVASWLAKGYVLVPWLPLPEGGLRQAFRVRRCHARWGAQMAACAGAGPRAVSLIRHHHATGPLCDEQLMALRNADET